MTTPPPKASDEESPTPFAELTDVLGELVTNAQTVLGDNFVGAYVVGSFAVGDADTESDCDFLVPIRRLVNDAEEDGLRAFHHELPGRDGHWNKHIEGSYPVVDDLQTLDGFGREWLFIDHGHTTMEWSTHCNVPEHRWTLRERALTLAGPHPASFACEIPPDFLREKMRPRLANFLPELYTWVDFSAAWTQRYAVATVCRMLYTIDVGAIASKRASLIWGEEHLDPRWSKLIRRARDERPLGWDSGAPPHPGSVEETLQFIEYANQLANPTSSPPTRQSS